MAGLASSVDSPGSAIGQTLTGSSTDRRFLRSVYIDLTGRSPLAGEYQGAEGKSREVVVRDLVGSRSFFRGFYEGELFYFLLVDNFRPSTEGFERIPKLLAARKMSVRDCLRRIVSSQFFNARNPGNDTFVTVVLEQLLGITVQKSTRTLEAGKKMYDGGTTKFLGRSGHNQADLVQIAVEDEGFEPFLLGRHFEAIFRTPMPKKRKMADAKFLRENPLGFPDVVGNWLLSEAYEEVSQPLRSKTDRVFVNTLFVDVLQREPKYQEFRRCRNALLALSDSNPIRSVLIKLMLDAESTQLDVADPQRCEEFVSEQFQRFLCREPTAEENRLFCEELAKPHCDEKTIVRALLTHWEYHHY